MKKTRVLFVSQEITPYLEETPMSKLCRHLPQGIQELGREIRVFMPRYGNVNERRNQLHEVIRLSGMNLIIDDSDHPLIIKVGSIQAARMQVYFIDNHEYFERKAVMFDKNGASFKDNDERIIFFCRGVIETLKKLGWTPDIIHCHGWMTSALPLYIKTAFREDPIFADARVIYSIYNEDFSGSLGKDYTRKLKIDGIENSDLKHLDDPDFINITKNAITMSDAVIMGSETINPELIKHIKRLNKPMLSYQSEEDFVDVYNDFYDEIIELEPAYC